MNKIITVAMAIMLVLTGLSTYTVYSQANEIQNLRADVDEHTSFIMVRMALGDHTAADISSLYLPKSAICQHPSADVKKQCEMFKDNK
jgi:hypothetical protein